MESINLNTVVVIHIRGMKQKFIDYSVRNYDIINNNHWQTNHLTRTRLETTKNVINTMNWSRKWINISLWTTLRKNMSKPTVPFEYYKGKSSIHILYVFKNVMSIWLSRITYINNTDYWRHRLMSFWKEVTRMLIKSTDLKRQVLNICSIFTVKEVSDLNY